MATQEKEVKQPEIEMQPVTPGAFFIGASSMLALGFALGFRQVNKKRPRPRIEPIRTTKHRPELLYGSEGVGIDRLEEVAEKADMHLATRALALGSVAALATFGFMIGSTCYFLGASSVCFHVSTTHGGAVVLTLSNKGNAECICY